MEMLVNQQVRMFVTVPSYSRRIPFQFPTIRFAPGLA